MDCCLFFFDLWILITALVSFGHCVVCSCWTCGFSLPLWYILGIVLSVLVGLAASHYPFGIFWPLCCLFLLNLRLLITSLASSNLSYCLWIIRSCLEHTIYYTWGEPANYYTMDEERTDNTKAKRYQRGNEKPQVQQEQTTQWPKDTKGVMRSRKSNKNRQHNGQKILKG
jgi:hypothetical protein